MGFRVVAKPRQQPFNKGNASAGKMNERELVQQNPMSPFGQGFTAPAKSGGSSTAKPIPKTTPTAVKYKGRKITAQPDIARIDQRVAGKIPMMIKPKAKVVNKRND